MKGKRPYPSKDAVNRLLLHIDDGVFSQTRRDGAEVVQGRHPERHFCLFVAELVHLKRGGDEDRALTAGDRCSRGSRDVNDTTHQQPAKQTEQQFGCGPLGLVDC